MTAEAGAIAQQIRAYIGAELAPSGRVSLDTPLLTGLIDSLDLMELVGYVETEFGIALQFPDMNETNFRDARSLAALVVRLAG
jgi:acyl carrier protein